MRRGTTPTHTFSTDVDLSDSSVLYVTYEQNNGIIVEVDKSRCSINENSVVTSLTQEETLKFQDCGDVLIQIRAGWSNGKRVASNIMRVPIERVIKDGVI